MKLEHEVCITTGAARRISRATASPIGRKGAVGIACDVNPAAVDAECRASGAMGDGFGVDVTGREPVDAMVATVDQQHGRTDALVDHAGSTKDARATKMTLAPFDAVIGVNRRGVFPCAQAGDCAVVNQGCGVILDTGAVVGSNASFGQTNAAASKFGVIALTGTRRRDLGPKGFGSTRSHLVSSRHGSSAAFLTKCCTGCASRCCSGNGVIPRGLRMPRRLSPATKRAASTAPRSRSREA